MASTETTKFTRFHTPAFIDDFAAYGRPSELGDAFRSAWSTNIGRWTAAGIVGNPWTNQYDDERGMYVNPIGVQIPADVTVVSPTWFAFPQRVQLYGTMAGYDQNQIYRLADYGKLEDGTGLPCIPTDPCVANPKAAKTCEGSGPTVKPWYPAGPRGWLDEYCEWSVLRAGETILSISFTCENPEYWATMWKVDPTLVREIYQDLVSYGKNKAAGRVVKLEDLYLTFDGKVVIDQDTGRPAYDILNKWNFGTAALPDRGGAIHLTSPPNTLGAEIYLGAAATILRTSGGSPVPTASDSRPILVARDLICAAQYGNFDRNSDPNIGHSVNQVVRELKANVTLKDPVGLYIQEPDFSRFELPAGKVKGGITPRDCWNLIRGVPGMGLHAVFEVPEGQDFTINDIKIDGQNIQYAGQIAEAFQIGLSAWGLAPSIAPTLMDYPKVGDRKPALPQVQQPILDGTIFLAQSPIRPSLTFAPPRVAQGSSGVVGYVLPCVGVSEGVTVEFTGKGVSAEVIGIIDENDNAIGTPALSLKINVASDAEPGDYGVVVRNKTDVGPIPAAPAMLEVVPSTTPGDVA